MAPSGRRCSQTIPFPPLPPPPPARRHPSPPPPSPPPPTPTTHPPLPPPTPSASHPSANPFIILLYIRPLAIEAYATPCLLPSLFSRHPPPPPWLFTPHAQTLPPSHGVFHSLRSSFLSPRLPPPPTPSLSNHDETQPLTLGLLRIINFSHT